MARLKNAVIEGVLKIQGKDANGKSLILPEGSKIYVGNSEFTGGGGGGGIALPDSAASHNAIFRGEDLTGKYTVDQICERISSGTFEDLYIGDYFDITFTNPSGSE